MVKSTGFVTKLCDFGKFLLPFWTSVFQEIIKGRKGGKILKDAVEEEACTVQAFRTA